MNRCQSCHRLHGSFSRHRHGQTPNDKASQANHPDQQNLLDNTRKGWYFFYGPLMDLSTLARVLQVAMPPRSHPARVIGYQTRLWGAYPALIDEETGQMVEGIAWQILSQNHLDRRIVYEISK